MRCRDLRNGSAVAATSSDASCELVWTSKVRDVRHEHWDRSCLRKEIGKVRFSGKRMSRVAMGRAPATSTKASHALSYWVRDESWRVRCRMVSASLHTRGKVDEIKGSLK